MLPIILVTALAAPVRVGGGACALLASGADSCGGAVLSGREGVASLRIGGTVLVRCHTEESQFSGLNRADGPRPWTLDHLSQGFLVAVLPFADVEGLCQAFDEQFTQGQFVAVLNMVGDPVTNETLR